MIGADRDPPDDRELLPQRSVVPESENGFKVLQESSASVSWPEANEPDDENLREMAQGGTWDDQRVSRLLRDNDQAMALLERAIAFPRFQIPEPVSISDRAYSILPWRRLSDILVLRSRRHYRAGRETQAFEDALRLVRFGYLLEAAEGGLIDYLIGTSLKRQGFSLLREWLPETRQSATGVCDLLSRLEPYGADPSHLQRALRQDYVELADVVEDPSGELPMRLLSFPFLGRYIYQRNRTRAMLADGYRILIHNVSVPYTMRSTPEVVPRDDVLEFAASPNFVGKIVYENALPSEKTWMQQHWGETDFSATRLGVALECYRRRHGQTPATLEELVPEILDAVPRDAFDGESLRYDADRRAIYSIGPDLIDEGGSDGEHPSDMPDPTYVLGQ